MSDQAERRVFSRSSFRLTTGRLAFGEITRMAYRQHRERLEVRVRDLRGLKKRG